MKATVDLGAIENQCFVIMPFQPRFDLVYQEVFIPAIQDAGLEAVRADEIYGARRVMQDVWDRIRAARIVLAELTGRNANVLYELGLAHAIGKAVIIVTNTMDDVPFDLKDIRCIVYETHHPRWGENLRTKIVETLKAVLIDTGNAPTVSGIELSENYPRHEDKPISPPTPAIEFNVAGEWLSEEVWVGGSPERRRTTIELQQDGMTLTGQAKTIGLDKSKTDPSVNEKLLVQQTLTGSITGREVQMVATNFEVIEFENPLTLNWSLESWTGTLEPPDLIVGLMASTGTGRGSFTMRRMPKGGAAE